MIGDSLTDIEFGRNLGIRTILIEGDISHQPGASKAAELAGPRCQSLQEAVVKVLT